VDLGQGPPATISPHPNPEWSSQPGTAYDQSHLSYSYPASTSGIFPRLPNILPVPDKPVLPAHECLPADLLQLLNKPVVAQLGGEGASPGPVLVLLLVYIYLLLYLFQNI
jgi:hypothetical protein